MLILLIYVFNISLKASLKKLYALYNSLFFNHYGSAIVVLKSK